MGLILNYDELREQLLIYTRGIITSMDIEKWVYKVNMEKKLPEYLTAPIKYSAFVYIMNELKTSRPFDKQFSEEKYLSRAKLFLDTLDEKNYFNDSIVVNIKIGGDYVPQIDNLLYKMFLKSGVQGTLNEGDVYFCEYDIEMFGESLRISRAKTRLVSSRKTQAAG